MLTTNVGFLERYLSCNSNITLNPYNMNQQDAIFSINLFP